jgi:hypothetical protein
LGDIIAISGQGKRLLEVLYCGRVVACVKCKASQDGLCSASMDRGCVGGRDENSGFTACSDWVACQVMKFREQGCT